MNTLAPKTSRKTEQKINRIYGIYAGYDSECVEHQIDFMSPNYQKMEYVPPSFPTNEMELFFQEN